MSYHSVVCIKQVPDTKRVTGNAMKPDGTVNRAALPAIFNPDDLHALEEALRVRDAHGGTVTVLTMGLPAASAILRESLCLGADRAVLVTDRRAAASDTLATSYILSCALRRLEPDLVFCGRQAIDGDTAQTGPQIAEKLGFTLVTYLEELSLEDGAAIVRRNLGNGTERVRARLPALFTVVESANHPRPPAARRIFRFKKALAPAEVEKAVEAAMPGASAEARAAEAASRCDALREKGLLIEQWNLDGIGADLANCGAAGSPTRVHRIESVVLAGGDYKEFPPDAAGVGELVAELVASHTLG
ncbi:MAG: electron transfer flavoprotein subunit beta/FixA family protein [Kiritimatiellia bacterium]|jgi:electron transfer flavoprotein beta subunit